MACSGNRPYIIRPNDGINRHSGLFGEQVLQINLANMPYKSTSMTGLNKMACSGKRPYINFVKLFLNGGRAIPFSVIMADMYFAGVTSKAGFKAFT